MQARVLICEDNAFIAWELESVVVAAGGEPVGIAQDSVTARRLAATRSPDLALVDLTLLDGNTGAELARDLVAKGIRVIILSGAGDQRPSLEDFSHTFAHKPLPEDVLQELLKSQMAAL